jgi:D-amino-acid dehydrogenase
MKFDTLVLGGGIVGVSTALHLQKQGRTVALIDHKTPGIETSLGNAGLIQREGVYPYAFPRDAGSLIRYARNTALDVRYHANAMGSAAPFLAKNWYHSKAKRHADIARAYSTLIAHCVAEHRSLAEEANATRYLRSSGWIKVFRTSAVQDREIQAVERWQREYGVGFEVLDQQRLQQVEPDLDHRLLGGLRYIDADSVSDPKSLLDAYLAYFKTLGGKLFIGDASTLKEAWTVTTQEGDITAASVVVALGPWSKNLTDRLGYRLPLGVKRGYHMHYAAGENRKLTHPVLDAENGYMLAPMDRGIRLTTGAEIARPDAPKTPVQLEAIEPIARTLMQLGKRLDAEPWMGRRPCTPDMMPVIGPASRHKGMWFAFGHAHHGLTLGPVTGRLIAEMMTGKTTLVDVSPFRVERFE